MSFRTASGAAGSRRLSRRIFLGAAAASTGLRGNELQALVDTGLVKQRRKDAYRIRLDAARQQLEAAQPDQMPNGDEDTFASKFGSYSKGLPHNAGVHWRSDYAESLRLGEAVALSVLQDQRLTYREQFDGYTLTKFDGTKMTV